MGCSRTVNGKSETWDFLFFVRFTNTTRRHINKVTTAPPKKLPTAEGVNDTDIDANESNDDIVTVVDDANDTSDVDAGTVIKEDVAGNNSGVDPTQMMTELVPI